MSESETSNQNQNQNNNGLREDDKKTESVGSNPTPGAFNIVFNEPPLLFVFRELKHHSEAFHDNFLFQRHFQS